MDANGLAFWVLMVWIAVTSVLTIAFGVVGKKRSVDRYGAVDVVIAGILLFLVYLICSGGYLP